MEEWRDIVGYEGRYRVSNLGRVRSLERNIIAFGRPTTKKPRILEPCYNRGYQQVTLRNSNGQVTGLIHRLVAIAFIPNPNHFREINHRDGDKTNNAITNLEWCNRQMNMSHAKKSGLLNPPPRGENHFNSKFTCNEILSIRGEFLNGHAYNELANKHGVTPQAIRNIVSRRTWKHI